MLHRAFFLLIHRKMKELAQANLIPETLVLALLSNYPAGCDRETKPEHHAVLKHGLMCGSGLYGHCQLLEKHRNEKEFESR